MPMADRKSGLTIYLDDLGRGTVVRNLPPERLIAPNQTGLIAPTHSPQVENLRLYEGEVDRRDGYSVFSSAPDALTVNGLYLANFSHGTVFLVRAAAGGGIYRYAEASDTWSDIAGGETFGNTANQPFTFAMTVRSGGSTDTWMLVGTEGHEQIYKWDGGGNISALGGSPPLAPKVLLSWLGRAFALNVIDPDTGLRDSTRVQYTVVNDSEDWLGLGSGYTALDGDPYPIANAAVIGGRMSIFKGSPNGGSVYVATPTGDNNIPIRYDMVGPTAGVGILVPRSLVALAPSMVFFLGHDAAYVFDGVRALSPFAPGAVRDIRERLNLDALNTGFSYYNRETNEVHLYIATGSSKSPNELWIFDIRSKRAYGPNALNDSVYSAAAWIDQGSLTWSTWGQVTTRQWATLLDEDGGDEYEQWQLVTGPDGYGTLEFVLGGGSGDTFTTSSAETDDNGTDIDSVYYTPAITPTGWVVQQGPQTARSLRNDDVLILRRFGLMHRSNHTWTPQVEVSTNGGTSWTAIDDDTNITAVGDRLATKNYYPQLVQGTWFQFRIKNTTGDRARFHSIVLEFTYAGSERHE